MASILSQREREPEGDFAVDSATAQQRIPTTCITYRNFHLDLFVVEEAAFLPGLTKPDH